MFTTRATFFRNFLLLYAFLLRNINQLQKGAQAMRLTIPIPAFDTLGLPATEAAAPELTVVGPAPTFEVECSYRPGTPHVYTLPNGDPGYPGDPDEVEIDRISSPVPLVWEGEGVTLAVAAGANLLSLLSARDHARLEGRIAALAEQAGRDAADEARIDRAEAMRNGW
jgi:hypothetical protein